MDRERGRRWLGIVIVLAFIGILTIRSIATFWTDFLWFSDLGQSRTWRTLILTRVWLVLAATLVAMLLFWINLAVADRLSPRTGSFGGSPDEELLERFQTWIAPRVRWVRIAVAGATRRLNDFLDYDRESAERLIRRERVNAYGGLHIATLRTS